MSKTRINMPSGSRLEVKDMVRIEKEREEQKKYPWSDTEEPSESEEKMRLRLQFFFMDPVEKWQAKRRFPYKFIVQLVKILLVTMQLCLFAHSRYMHVNYTEDSRVTFSNLFLKDWDSSREVNSYPAANGPLAIYKINEFYDIIDYAYTAYCNIDNAVGSYSYDSENNSMIAPKLCLVRYKQGIIFGFNESYVFNPDQVENCYDLKNVTNNTEFSTQDYLKSRNVTILFSELIRAQVSFSVKTVNFKVAGRIRPPDCYEFKIQIIFDNEDHDGQVKIFLEADPYHLQCKGDVYYITDNKIDAVLRSLLNYLVIFICFASLALCCRAVYRAQLLRTIAVTFFKNTYDYDLTPAGKLQFLNIWYIMIVINDIFIIIGSSIKEQIEQKDFQTDQWNICSVFLGTGNMLVWFGVLRYLGFFKTYNVVILTLKGCAPKLVRYLTCALLIYAGYTFCGWLVLGPYHDKFRSLATTGECLFSLINGDDMFATFSIMSEKSTMLWWYSRIYLYSFICLFIYAILSMFIAVIMDSYDTIKEYYVVGFPKNDLQDFVGSVPAEKLSSGVFRSVMSDSEEDTICCCIKKRSYSPLLNDKNVTPRPSAAGNCV